MIVTKSKSETQIFRGRPLVEKFKLSMTQLLDDFSRAT